jgi:uncharacterized membrane protein
MQTFMLVAVVAAIFVLAQAKKVRAYLSMCAAIAFPRS